MPIEALPQKLQIVKGIFDKAKQAAQRMGQSMAVGQQFRGY